MMFGSKNAPYSFQCVLNIILYSVKYQLFVLYHDEVDVFSRIPRQHMDRTRLVLTILKEADVSSQLKNCAVLTKGLTILVILSVRVDSKLQNRQLTL